MASIVVTPVHDPQRVFLPHLEAITPALKEIFSQAIWGVTSVTAERYPAEIERLRQEPFFRVMFIPTDQGVGDQFAQLYRQAAETCPGEAVLHLCFIDRLAYILQSQYRQDFTADVQQPLDGAASRLFQRSQNAWLSHPHNYYQIEQFLTTTGEHLFGKSLDFAWCHLAIQAARLRTLMPFVRGHDFTMLAEMILFLQDEIQTKDVDWLAWEDPFLLARPAAELQRERAGDCLETHKRLAYVIPMLQRLFEYSRSAGH